MPAAPEPAAPAPSGPPQSRPGSAVAAVVPELPAFWELRAPDSWATIDFISDLHLAADTPNAFEALARHLQHTPADAVFILGDLFEAWVGDDSRHHGFEKQCADLLAEAASRRSVAFMPGNRDFLVGADLLRACGVMALADPTVLIAFGERVMLSHGDALCLGDVTYQRFRAMVRSPYWRDDFLARPLAVRERLAREIRHESERRKGEQLAGRLVDIDCAAAVRWMHEAAAPTLIHGHTHAPGSEEMAPGFTRHVLSDWVLDDPSDEHPGAHCPPRAELLRWRRGSLQRLPPADATPAPATPAATSPAALTSSPTRAV